MTNDTIAKAIIEVSDICACASNDMHTCHLNYKGPGFDIFHKDVLKEYYEQLDTDYDSAAEFACCYDTFVPNKNATAGRIGYLAITASAGVDMAQAINIIHEILTRVVDNMHMLFKAMTKLEDDPIAVGVANWLQGRIEYWAKELNYFNARRKE